MDVTRIYQVVEYTPSRCFREFVREVTNDRRLGDRDPSMAILADTSKLRGNSSYGSLIMDQSKHREIKHVKGIEEATIEVNDSKFINLTDLGHHVYEIEKAKSRISYDLPVQLGYFILQYAKLRMLQFYYDFVDKYVERSDFAYCEMDTDSAYMAISGRNLESIVKPELIGEFRHGLMN
ncbi:uncharacterized protein LOC133198129 [Saccostrea echinata]|uniref:uncharacterized protein LOC133198129 n=1 Tax=Saccostrea echinata TaxID=191078 RepID=UPI002A840CAD|nr:uncharacterized protein LOC133198129 [Saccostrea echinata]